MTESYRWFASHALTGRVLGGEISSLPPFHVRPESFSNWNCFLTVNRSGATGRLKNRDADVSSIDRILVDLDVGCHGAVPFDHHEKIARSALADIGSVLGHRPSAVANFSGRGIQILLNTINYPLGGATHRYEWRNSVKKFLTSLYHRLYLPFGLHVDTCTSDLSRLCRAPDTINQTSKLMSYNILHEEGVPIDPYRFLSLYPVEKNPEPALPCPHPKSCWAMFTRLTVSARRFISEGATYGGRNDACFKAAISCLDNGISVEDTMKMLVKGNKMSTPPLDHFELSHILSNAIRRNEEDASSRI